MSSAESSPRVSVVIPNYNGVRWLPGCLEGLASQELQDFETIVVDDGSADESVALVRQSHPRVHLIALDRNRGFAVTVNEGIRAARGEYVALLNNDTIARPRWLKALVRRIEASPAEVAAVASKMLSMDDPDCVDDAGDSLSWLGAACKIGHGRPAADFVEARDVLSPSAGAALYRRSFLEEVRGFDERFFAYLEDVDLGLRGRLLGYRYLFEPEAEVLHEGHGSRMPRSTYVRLSTRNRALLFAKCVPLSLLLAHLPRLAYGQIYFLIAYRKPLQSLAGYASLFRCLPHVVRERRRIHRERRLSSPELERLLSRSMSEPPLRELLRRRFQRSRP